ncbi:MAG: hypothetical protein E4H19_01920 [Chromatiales bacterium]|jgi:hypothetical protein|nr:MAG: hypothetical protein E4H19_01920 [Chromatiales bacterium]
MNRAILGWLLLLLAACGAPAVPDADREPPSNVIGDPLQQSLDKARSVEDLSGSRKSGLDDAIDDAN